MNIQAIANKRLVTELKRELALLKVNDARFPVTLELVASVLQEMGQVDQDEQAFTEQDVPF